MIHAASIVPMTRTLTALSAILAKTEAHCAARKIDPAVLFGARLYPDMLPLSKQVQLACDFAARAAARLAGAEVPSFPDTETTLSQLQDRISATCAYLASFGPDRFEGAAERSITLKLRGGEKVFQGLEFLTLFALPQVYFHATTAYDILRHNGVEIGKLDFMGA